MTQSVSLSYEDEQAFLTLHRPPANLLDHTVCDEIERHARTLAHVSPAGGLIVTAADTFCGGLDPASFDSEDGDEAKALYVSVNRMLAAFYSIGCPVTAALNGDAAGIGFVLALCADYRLVHDSAQISLQHTITGMPFPRVAVEIMHAEMTPQSLRSLALGGISMTPQSALSAGLIDQTVSGGLLDTARTLTANRADNAAFSAIKRQLRSDVIERCHALADQDSDPATAALGILMLD